MSITRTVELDDLTPEELAFAFCEMDGGQQATFFSTVGKIASTWTGAGWCQQCCEISRFLDKPATDAILKLGEWAAEPYIAQGIEAGTGETREAGLDGDSHESPVPQGCAQTPPENINGK